MTLRATLVSDGSSDIVLLPILRWLVRQATPHPIELRWADLRGVPRPPRVLADRLAIAVEYYPCDLLFVHRDAERQPPGRRYQEISKANSTGTPHVGVVPVRMQETWLLLDELAVREAAGRPSGTEPLSLGGPETWEGLPDPKGVLHRALVTASGARGRRAKRFNPARATHRLADLVDDWSPLRRLAAFRQLEADTRAALASFHALLTPPAP
jgi:hypothetical protein